MSSIFGVALCLMTTLVFASCASSNRTVAQENEVKRAPDFRNNNKEFNRQFSRGQY